jgi:hypothetical protein
MRRSRMTHIAAATGLVTCLGSPARAQDATRADAPVSAALVEPAAPVASDESLPPIVITPLARIRLVPEPRDEITLWAGVTRHAPEPLFRCDSPCVVEVQPGEYTVRFRRRASLRTDTWTDDVSRAIQPDMRGLLVRREHPVWPLIVTATGAAAAAVGVGILIWGVLSFGVRGTGDVALLGTGGGLLGGGLLFELIGAGSRSGTISAEVPAPVPVRSRVRVTAGLAGFVVTF